MAWYEWNGNFRDVWRAFVNYDDRPLNAAEGPVDIGAALTASHALFGDDGRRPYHSVNFVTVHDGFTLYDLLSYDQKQNGCGPLNPVCCERPSSPFCDRQSGEDNNRSRDWGQDAEPFKRQLARTLLAATFLSQGTPLLLGGDEWLRTQLGNNNAYSDGADNPYNWYQWGTYQASNERRRMHDFVRALIRLRKRYAWALAPDTWQTPPTWLDAGGGSNPAWGSRHIALRYDHPSGAESLLILINMELGPVDFTLPPGKWVRLMDTQQWFDDTPFFQQSGADPTRTANVTLEHPEPISGPTYGVPTRTIVVLATP